MIRIVYILFFIQIHFNSEIFGQTKFNEYLNRISLIEKPILFNELDFSNMTFDSTDYELFVLHFPQFRTIKTGIDFDLESRILGKLFYGKNNYSILMYRKLVLRSSGDVYSEEFEILNTDSLGKIHSNFPLLRKSFYRVNDCISSLDSNQILIFQLDSITGKCNFSYGAEFNKIREKIVMKPNDQLLNQINNYPISFDRFKKLFKYYDKFIINNSNRYDLTMDIGSDFVSKYGLKYFFIKYGIETGNVKLKALAYHKYSENYIFFYAINYENIKSRSINYIIFNTNGKLLLNRELIEDQSGIITYSNGVIKKVSEGTIESIEIDKILKKR